MSKRLAHAQDESDKEVNIGIIITPMLDMAFQLMAFFIMTYHPSALEGHIDGKLLPMEKVLSKSTSGAPKPKDLDEKPISADVDPTIKDAVLVTIKSVAPGQTEGKDEKGKPKTEGQPSRIMVKTTEGEAELVADSNDSESKAWDKLEARLKMYQKSMDPIRAAQKNSKTPLKTTVKLMPDSNLKHYYVVKAWGICKAAKFDTIGFVQPPDMPVAPSKLLREKE